MEKSDLKTIALKMARDINPNQNRAATQMSQLGSTEPPSLDKILTDAKKIYEWLSED